jgi:transglutaminase-like putative cysteine protease
MEASLAINERDTASAGAARLRDVFLYSIYGLAAVAAAMLAFGEGSPFPAAVTVPLAFAALVLNERRHRIRLSSLWVNALGLGALVISVAEFMGPSVEARLLSGAHFLVYLTWIVFFQDKQFRQYWWIGAFALLQVAVGAVLTNSGAYGFLLLAFLLLTLWTLAIANLFQRAGEFGALDAGVAGAGHRRQASSAFPSVTTSTVVSRAVHQDDPGRWIMPRFVWGILALSLAGLWLGLLIFLFVPRFWIGRGAMFSDRADASSLPVTGFSTEVRLGQLGQILEDTSVAFTLRLFDRDSDQPIDVFEFSQRMGYEAPLFRGVVLDTYDEGRWSRTAVVERFGLLPSAPKPDGLVRQEYRMGENDYGVLFALRPADLGAITKPYEAIRRETGTNTFFPSDRQPGRFEYYIWSRPVPHADLPDLLMGMRGRGAPDLAVLYLAMPKNTPRVAALAQEIAARAPARTGVSRARGVTDALVEHLRDSGEYSYSLTMRVTDAALDPVEDFLFNHKSGHCEYFATALTLLLRAARVPARLVTGFKGADATGTAGEFVVQQRHAHAWVEAWVDGQWVVLDPTPAAREEMVRLIAQRQGFWRATRDSLANFWSDYVVTLSLDRQREALYDPLRSAWEAARLAFSPLVDVARSFMDLTTSREGWTSGYAPAVLAAAMAAWFALVRLARFLRSRAARGRAAGGRGMIAGLKKMWRVVGRKQPGEFVVGFYDRFVDLVRAQGLTPGAAQTSREFAASVCEALLPRLEPQGLAAFPREVTEDYYAVRFGDRGLPQSRITALQDQLLRLERLLTQANGQRS